MKTKISERALRLRRYITKIKFRTLENERGQVKVTLTDIWGFYKGAAIHTIGYALKSPKDKYKVKLGEEIAYGRALKEFDTAITAQRIKVLNMSGEEIE